MITCDQAAGTLVASVSHLDSDGTGFTLGDPTNTTLSLAGTGPQVVDETAIFTVGTATASELETYLCALARDFGHRDLTAGTYDQIDTIPGDDLPTVTITSVEGGATPSGTDILIKATADDDTGILQVEFFADDDTDTVIIGVATSGNTKFQVSWDTESGHPGGGFPDADYELTAVATHTGGPTTTSTVFNVTVDNPCPSVSDDHTSPVWGTRKEAAR